MHSFAFKNLKKQICKMLKTQYHDLTLIYSPGLHFSIISRAQSTLLMIKWSAE